MHRPTSLVCMETSAVLSYSLGVYGPGARTDRWTWAVLDEEVLWEVETSLELVVSLA